MLMLVKSVDGKPRSQRCTWKCSNYTWSWLVEIPSAKLAWNKIDSEEIYVWKSSTGNSKETPKCIRTRKLIIFTWKLTLKDKAEPQSRKAREVPFALCPKWRRSWKDWLKKKSFHPRNLDIGRHQLCQHLKEVVKCESMGTTKIHLILQSTTCNRRKEILVDKSY